MTNSNQQPKDIDVEDLRLFGPTISAMQARISCELADDEDEDEDDEAEEAEESLEEVMRAMMTERLMASVFHKRFTFKLSIEDVRTKRNTSEEAFNEVAERIKAVYERDNYKVSVSDNTITAQY